MSAPPSIEDRYIDVLDVESLSREEQEKLMAAVIKSDHITPIYSAPIIDRPPPAGFFTFKRPRW